MAPLRPQELWLSVCLLQGAACNEFTFRGEDENVVDPIVLTETFTQASMPGLDILWIIDDTPSMTEEHAALAAALVDLLHLLDTYELSWQMGVITTSMDEDAGLLRGNPWIIHPDLDTPEQALLDAIDVGTAGAEPAAGLAAGLLALTDPLRSEENRGFRRQDAGLHVVVVSDSDDQSQDLIDGDPADVFVSFLASEAASTGQSASLSAVVGSASTGCSGAGGTALPGDTYLEVAERTGGASGSICDTDLSDVLTALGDAAIEWPTDFTLQTEPVPASLRVAVDGVRVSEGWSLIAATTLHFDEAPAPGATIDVRYEVVE